MTTPIIKSVKRKNLNGTFTDCDLGAAAKNIEFENGDNLEDSYATILQTLRGKLNSSGDTMTGTLEMGNEQIHFSDTGSLEWKQNNYGNKFRLRPNFTTGSLIFSCTTGDTGTDPVNFTDILTIKNDGKGYIGQYEIITKNSEEVKKKVATAHLDTGVSIGENIVPLDVLTSSSPNLTLYNNGIKIGANIHKILVSANLFVACNNVNSGYTWTQIRKNGAAVSTALTGNDEWFTSTAHTPKLIDVQENDVITLYKIDSNNNFVRAADYTYLTVEVVN